MVEIRDRTNNSSIDDYSDGIDPAVSFPSNKHMLGIFHFALVVLA